MYLAMDTTGPVAVFVLAGDDGSVVASRVFEGHRSLSQSFYEHLDALFESVSMTIDNVNGFSVTTGPGSFTGIRIGMTTAKTMAQVTGKPLVGIPTFDCLAHPYISVSHETVVTVLHSRRLEVYAAVFRAGAQICAPFAATPSELTEQIRDLSADGPVRVVGSPELLGVSDMFVPTEVSHISVESFAVLTAQKMGLGDTTSYLTLLPEYVVPPTITRPKT